MISFLTLQVLPKDGGKAIKVVSAKLGDIKLLRLLINL